MTKIRVVEFFSCKFNIVIISWSKMEMNIRFWIFFFWLLERPKYCYQVSYPIASRQPLLRSARIPYISKNLHLLSTFKDIIPYLIGKEKSGKARL